MNYCDNLLENAILELYFEEDEDIKIYKESMNDLLEEEYLTEAKLTKEEKEANKKEKLEKRIEKAKEKTIKRLTKRIQTSSNQFKKFELDSHLATTKERALYLAHVSIGGGTISGITGTAGNVAAAAMDGAYKGKSVAAAVTGTVAGGAINIAGYTMFIGSVLLINELIKSARYKEIYTVKLYGVKENGSKKLLQWWTTVKVEISDLPSDVRSKVKKYSK